MTISIYDYAKSKKKTVSAAAVFVDLLLHRKRFQTGYGHVVQHIPTLCDTILGGWRDTTGTGTFDSSTSALKTFLRFLSSLLV